MKKDSPLITIITATYNSITTIEESILSVVTQSYPNIEYIIIDGLSNDGTVKCLKKYKDKISYLISEPDSGIYNALNKALVIAKGDWILVLGSDDFLLPEAISKCVRFFDDLTAAYYGNVILTSNMRIFDGHFSLYKTMYYNISHQSIFYPRDFYQNNLYNEKYKSAADYEMLMRAIGVKCKLSYIPEIVVLYNNLSGISSIKEDENFLKDKRWVIKANYPVIYYALYMFRFYFVKLFEILGIKAPLKKMFKK
jgi:glycosyltransferase involved in cell wall biosynthesis